MLDDAPEEKEEGEEEEGEEKVAVLGKMLGLLETMMKERKELDQLRQKMSQQKERKPKEKKKALWFWTFVYFALISLAIAAGFVVLGFLILVIQDTREVGLREAQLESATEMERARQYYETECIKDKMSIFRRLVLSTKSFDEKGHVQGDSYCIQLRIAMNNPKEARADSKVMARKLAETMNGFVSTLSLKSWATIVMLRDGFYATITRVMNVLPYGNQIMTFASGLLGGLGGKAGPAVPA
eukprot:TRINITY_DN1429_c0_g1_i1.p1 TRINITY_DN1429_c0_g1~~TRINITY_DN1429_c0_g1_i1.p1  ORF type:complete len:261 (-),score=72.92 TRINITY_DN1429_c0_g1_i1:39-761(-)